MLGRRRITSSASWRPLMPPGMTTSVRGATSDLRSTALPGGVPPARSRENSGSLVSQHDIAIPCLRFSCAGLCPLAEMGVHCRAIAGLLTNSIAGRSSSARMRLHELRPRPAVDHAVVERRRQVHHLARAPSRRRDHRPLDDAVDADDRHLGAVDHRGGDDAAQRAQAGDRDGRAGQFLARALPLRAASARRAISAALDHRSRASASRSTGTIRPPSVCVAMPRCTAPWRVTHAGLVVEARVEQRAVAQRLHQRADQERQQGQLARSAPRFAFSCARSASSSVTSTSST